MKAHKFIALLALLSGLLLAGCENRSVIESAMAFEGSSISDDGTISIENSDGVKLKVVDSGKIDGKYANAEKMLEKMINDGRYEIVSVKTIYTEKGRLVKAEVWYREK